MLDVHIIKQRGQFSVDVNFFCPDGRLLALTGPSGSGKTTVIRALAGLDRPDCGHISYRKKYWYHSTTSCFLKPRKRKVGYMFQEHTLFPHLSVRKNIAFACRDDERVSKLLRLLSIEHLADSRPHRISGGERQRTALAQALASDPDVLLLDEPFSALDTMTRNRLRHLLLDLKESLKIPIIMVTHDLEEARQLSDQHICLEKGAVVACERKTGNNFIPSLLAPAPI
ncbi:MAG TPA: ATP-binding cassette domain-containing protein [Desulfobulbus sp.]|nr:ATP-binding cassette domain-containing protein [Desulfobulbus sp.]HHD64161.1 ATP-binding cassette domain-containing protein [Desulfobulbaceae bacterium]